jgi:DNA-binding NarL/FixJ family response regulator
VTNTHLTIVPLRQTMRHRDMKARSQGTPARRPHSSMEQCLLATMAAAISLTEATARIRRETAQALRALAAYGGDGGATVRRISNEDVIQQLSRVEDAIAALTSIPDSRQPQPGLPGGQPWAGRGDASRAAESLTAREETVLRLLCGPLPQREIGRELDVSMNTIKSHTRAIYRELGAADRRDAIQCARQLGILLAPTLTSAGAKILPSRNRLPTGSGQWPGSITICQRLCALRLLLADIHIHSRLHRSTASKVCAASLHPGGQTRAIRSSEPAAGAASGRILAV